MLLLFILCLINLSSVYNYNYVVIVNWVFNISKFYNYVIVHVVGSMFPSPICNYIMLLFVVRLMFPISINNYNYVIIIHVVLNLPEFNGGKYFPEIKIKLHNLFLFFRFFVLFMTQKYLRNKLFFVVQYNFKLMTKFKGHATSHFRAYDLYILLIPM